MKKILYMALAITLTASILGGCASSSSSTSSSSATSDSSIKSISIGVDDSYPPMEYRDEQNKLVGFDVDLGNAIGKKLGAEIKWVPTAWDGVIPALQAKKFDMILSSMSINDERKKEVNFSDAYIQGGPVIVVTNKEKDIKSAADLKGKVVGVQTGSTGADAAEANKDIKEVKKYEKITQALQDLAVGRVSAVVADDQVGRYYVGLDSDKYSVAAKMNDEPFGIAFRKSDTALQASVQKAFNDLKADGTLSTISKKWFKTDYYSK